MKHNIIESMLIGIIISQWKEWQLNNSFEQLLLVLCIAMLILMLTSWIRETGEWYAKEFRRKRKKHMDHPIL